MDVQVPFRVEYKTASQVPISEIIGSLQSLQAILEDSGSTLEKLIPGLEIREIKVDVEKISVGSLREWLIVGFLIAFQQDLESEVPALIEALTGEAVPAEFNTLVSVLAVAIIVYGASAAKDIVVSVSVNREIKRQKDALITEVAELTGNTPEKVEALLDDRYQKPKLLKRLANNSIQFFKPSKSQDNAPVTVNKIHITRNFIESVPDSFLLEDANDNETAKPHEKIELEIHAQDRDRDTVGWAAVPLGLHTKRLRMKLLDDVDAAQLWGKDRVKGDIMLIQKRVGLEFVPSEIHLTRIYDQ